MKQFIQILHGAGALLFAAALAVSCSGPLDPPASQNVPAPQDLPAPQDSSNTGTAVIRIGDGGGDGPSRTIMPTAPDAFSRYALTLTKGSTTLTPDAAGIAGTGVAVQLESGDWTAAVSAYRQWTATGGSSTEYLAAKGSAALTVTVGGSNSVAVPVEPVPIEAAAGVKGIFSWNITLPEGVTSAELKLGDTTPVNLLTTATGSVEKAAGTYNLFITMKKGGLNAGLYEWAYVYPGLESPAVFDFRSGGADALVFTDTVLLAGTVSASIPAGATALTVKAYSNSTHTSAIATPEASVSSSGGTWLLKIPASSIGQNVYVKATATVATGYAAGAATATAATLPSNGQADIALTVPVERLFVPVTGITGIATGKLSGTDLSLAAATVVPDNADNKTIVWSVVSAGTTGASIVSGNTLRTTAAGTAKIKATITNGLSLTTSPRDYTQEFTVTVDATFVAVTNITVAPTTVERGIDTALSFTVTPTNATNKTVTWSVYSAGTTGATIVSGKLRTTATGTATIRATVTNGLTASSNYTQNLNVTVADTIAPVLSAGSVEDLISTAGTTATLKFTSNEAGTYYYRVLSTSAGVPSATTIRDQGINGNASVGQNSISVTGLSAAANYTAYIIVGDAATVPNVSAVMTISGVITKTQRKPYVTNGYDIIKGKYMNSAEVKPNPILSLTALNNAATTRIYQNPYSRSDFTFSSGESIKSVYDEFSVHVEGGVDFIVFSASVGVGFNKSTFETKTNRYVRALGRQFKEQEHLEYATPADLKDYLDPSFKAAVNSMSAGDLLDYYGTHLITRCFLGGLAEIDYSFVSTGTKTATEITENIKAQYKQYSLGVDSSQTHTEYSDVQSTEFKFRALGGVDPGFTTPDAFLRGYTGWVSSINQHIELCGIDTYSNSFIPIWELAALVSPDRKALIMQEFDNRARAAGIDIGELRTVQKMTYIHNTAGNKIFSYPHKKNSANEPLPAQFDIYLIGGGGGGQGDNNNWGWGGTGGAGGGGAASYLSFTTAEPTTIISLTAGTGGSGGTGKTFSDRGDSGGDGTASYATWSSGPNFTILGLSFPSVKATANGGKGGGQAGVVTGGAGGTASSSIVGYGSDSAPGEPGRDGNNGDGNKNTWGGVAGTLGAFGNESVAGNNEHSNTMNGTYGGGGAGAASDKAEPNGGKGGDGLIKVDYYYYE